MRADAGSARASTASSAESEAVVETAAAAVPQAAPPAAKPAAQRPTSSVPAPAPTVRVRTETLDRFLGAVGEVILSTRQLHGGTQSEEEPATQRNAELSEGYDRVERRVNELQRRVLDLRTTPLLRVMENLPRMARQVAARSGKRVEVEIRGSELELDRSILDRLNEPLLHIVRNAADHGLEDPQARAAAGKSEVGHIVIEARRQKNSIVIDVKDDGKGIDLDSVRARAVEAGLLHPGLAEDLPPDEIVALVFKPGLSTAASISDVSGRGVGMDAVKATIESLGGTVGMQTERGVGTTMTLEVPITAAVQRVLLVGIANERVALPITKVERILEVPASAIERSGGEAFALIDEEPMLVLELSQCVSVPPSGPLDPVPLVIIEVRGERVALEVERFASQQEIYVKPVPVLLSSLKLLAGMTILEDGRPVFLLDLNHLI